ncbi:hypothetical protein NQ318_000897 [Aromia moschata]|uniref:Uncharacterized protein n=1 Tax=Aromia moschata TaxID=1265417 RepID=A0AAV8ZGD2_9CUCU|nr:hypothetical protein NQ318_000897 [Aromia moschata]
MQTGDLSKQLTHDFDRRFECLFYRPCVIPAFLNTELSKKCNNSIIWQLASYNHDEELFVGGDSKETSDVCVRFNILANGVGTGTFNVETKNWTFSTEHRTTTLFSTRVSLTKLASSGKD